MLLGLIVVPIGVGLFLRRPAVLGKDGNAPAGDICRRALRLVLAYRRLGLLETVLKLRNLRLNFRCRDLGEELSGLDVIADIDVALRHIAAGARKDICCLESQRRCRQSHMQSAETLGHRFDAHARHEARLLFGGVHDLPVLLVMPPYAQAESGGKQQQYTKA